MARALIGLDVDGVVASFHEYACRQLGLDIEKLTSWSFRDSFGKETSDEIRQIVNNPATWVSLDPLPGAVEAVHTLRDAGIPVFFMSAFPKEFSALRVWWLNKHFGEDAYELLVTASAEEKPEVAQTIGLTHFVEDRPTTATAMAEAGLESVLVPTRYMGEPPAGVIIEALADFAARMVAQENRSKLVLPNYLTVVK